MNVLYIGVCTENLEKHYPSYIKGIFLYGGFTDDQLVDTVKQHHINVLMVDVFHASFTLSLLNRLKHHIKLINFSYQSIDSLIDLQEAEHCGIEVKKLPDDIYCNEVAEFAITQLLCACKGTIQFHQSVKTGEWNQAINTNFTLRGNTLGVVGFGKIGKRIVELCENWGMNILVTRKQLGHDLSGTDVTLVDFETLMERSNFIILALPSTKDTFQMVDESSLQNLKSNSIIVNVSRGNIVDEVAVSAALETGKLHRYCTDVFSREPVSKGNELVRNDKTILSPHIAWATESSLKKTYDIWFSQMTLN